MPMTGDAWLSFIRLATKAQVWGRDRTLTMSRKTLKAFDSLVYVEIRQIRVTK